MEEKKEVTHSLHLEKRGHGLITGVTEMKSFDEENIFMETSQGTLAIRSDSFHEVWHRMHHTAGTIPLLAWGVILFAPRFLIGIFSSDQALITDAIPALKLYFGAFVFQALQYVGQTMFKSLGKKKFAIFFSLLRKVIIVVPLTYILPYLFHMGSDGVFLAEPVSNVLGGSACFIVMLCTVMPELKRMAKENSDC